MRKVLYALPSLAPDGIPVALCALLLVLTAGPSYAGGAAGYEFGSADIGLATAGYGARAQDASTVLTNAAGMTRLEGTQVLGAGMLIYGDTEFSIDSGTSPGLGNDDGSRPVGSDGWFAGGSGFVSHSLTDDLKLGFGIAGTFGGPIEYDDDWVGRYYVQEGTIIGVSLLPSIAYKATDKLSVSVGLNAMYGYFRNSVAINNPVPAFDDGRLKLDDETWGFGANIGLLYELDAGTRIGLTYSSAVDLDFKAPAEFSGLEPGLEAALGANGLLNSNIKVGITVPQQVMASLYTQLNGRWAVLASLGWQDWSEFGHIQLGIDDTRNPVSLTTDLDFKDTWHGAVGAQYQLDGPWLLNFGIAYDSDFQSGDVSPLLPLNGAWRFGFGGERKSSEKFRWGLFTEVIYGGTLDVNEQGSAPVVIGGRGDLAGSYDDTTTLFAGAYFSQQF